MSFVVELLDTIDLNADVGEGCGFDAALMRHITSANICPGSYAGSPEILRETVALAIHHGVAIGAHPGFADREHVGRNAVAMHPADVEALVTQQLAAVARAASAQGARMHHVKPHGALYNMAARDRQLADAIARAITTFARALILYAPPSSTLAAAGLDAGLQVACEVFADRAYAPNGSLVPRSLPGAVIDKVDDVVARGVRMALQGSVVASDGSTVSLRADSICIHGDTAGCAALAQRLRAALEDRGVRVAQVRRVAHG